MKHWRKERKKDYGRNLSCLELQKAWNLLCEYAAKERTGGDRERFERFMDGVRYTMDNSPDPKARLAAGIFVKRLAAKDFSKRLLTT